MAKAKVHSRVFIEADEMNMVICHKFPDDASSFKKMFVAETDEQSAVQSTYSYSSGHGH